jgi:hypothetical protein
MLAGDYCGCPWNPVIKHGLEIEGRGFMKEGEDYNYEIRKHNFQTMSGGTSVCVVKGRAGAEFTVEVYDRKLSTEEKEAGWSHYLQRTTLATTIKPKKHRAHKLGSGRNPSRR